MEFFIYDKCVQIFYDKQFQLTIFKKLLRIVNISELR